MKRYFYSLALALVALVFVMPQLTHANHINVSTLTQLHQVMMNENGAFSADGYRVGAQDTICLASDIIEDVDKSQLHYWNNWETAESAIQLIDNDGSRYYLVGAAVVNGKKHLDLKGHTIQVTYTGDPTNMAIGVFYLPATGPETGGSLTISDTEGEGKVVIRSPFTGTDQPTAAILCGGSSNFTLFGGSLSAEYLWSGAQRCNYGLYNFSKLSHKVNIYGGSIRRARLTDADDFSQMGGTVENVWVQNEIGNDAFPSSIKFFNGTLSKPHFGGVSISTSTVQNEWLPKSWQVKQFVIDGSIVDYDGFASALASAAGRDNKSFVINNLNYSPVILNGTVGFSVEKQYDLLGDGSASFDQETNTLILRSADLSKIELNCFDDSSNPEFTILVRGKCHVGGSGIIMNNAHLAIKGMTGEDTLTVFGAGCRAIATDKQMVLYDGVHVNASATYAHAIDATQLIMAGASLEASAESRAVNCDISFWENGGAQPYNFLSGNATSKAFSLKQDIRKFKIWIAGKQLTFHQAYGFGDLWTPLQSDYVTGKIYVDGKGLLTEGRKIILYLENVTINARGLRIMDGKSFGGKGVPAVEIQEDSVTVLMENTIIYSGDPEGIKPEGLDNRYYADGGHGIYFKPEHNNCELIIRSNVTEKSEQYGSLYINTFGEYQSSYPIRCEGPRLYVECTGTADSIILESKLPLFCKTGLTLDDATIFSRGGFKTSNTPVITENSFGKSCYIAWPRAASFNSTGGVTGSTDNANNGVLVLENTYAHSIPYTVEVNDESMGYCTPSSYEATYGRNLSIKANPNSGYQFKEWHIYRKGKTGYITDTEQNTTVEILSETRCVAMLEPTGGTPEKYDVWLKDVQVTSANCLDPAGDGKAEYKHQDGLGQITLNGVNWAVDGPAIYTDGISEVRVYCYGDNSVKGQSDWTMYFGDADVARIYFDTLRVSFYEPDGDSQGIFLSRYDTHNGVIELRNKLTHITGTSADHVAIVADTLKILDGSILVVDNAGMDIREGLVMPENYMIYPAGTYLADNGTMRDASNNEVRTFRIAPKDPETPTYTITVNVNDPTMGSAAGGGIFEEGEEVTLTATPNDGYEFVEWSTGSTENPFIAPACMDATITAIFREIESQGIEDIIANPQSTAHKRILNGQLFIIRDGKIFNAQGAQIQ